MAAEQDHDDDDDDTDYEALNPEDYEVDENGDPLSDEAKAESKAARIHQELADGSDRAVARWMETQPEEIRTAVIDQFVETGDLPDHVAAGVHELELQVVEAAFAGHIERNILKPVGLTMEQWQDHIAEEDLPEFRRAVIAGDWGRLIDHARAAAKMRLDLGI